jgi:ACT domain-containing protein
VKIPEILIVETVHQPGSLARVLQVIADAGLTIDHLQALRREQGRTHWEITLEMDEEADRSLYARIDALPIARCATSTRRASPGSASRSGRTRRWPGSTRASAGRSRS